MSTEKILSSDGIPLEISLKKAERKNKFKAVMLVGPLFLFLIITYVFPIGDMLFRSVDLPALVLPTMETYPDLVLRSIFIH